MVYFAIIFTWNHCKFVTALDWKYNGITFQIAYWNDKNDLGAHTNWNHYACLTVKCVYA